MKEISTRLAKVFTASQNGKPLVVSTQENPNVYHIIGARDT